MQTPWSLPWNKQHVIDLAASDWLGSKEQTADSFSALGDNLVLNEDQMARDAQSLMETVSQFCECLP